MFLPSVLLLYWMKLVNPLGRVMWIISAVLIFLPGVHAETLTPPQSDDERTATGTIKTDTIPATVPAKSASASVSAAEPERLAADPTTLLSTSPAGAIDKTETPDLPAFPDSSLACGAVPPKTPHVVVILKTRNGEKQVRHRVVCLGLAPDRDDLSDSTRHNLNTIVEYVTGLDNVVRMYLDLITHEKDNNDLETRYRRQAFEIKKYLTEKGVFAHMQKNREGHFPVPFADAEDKKAKALADAQAAAVKVRVRPPKPIAKPPQRRDTAKEYTYYVNRPGVNYLNDNPSQFTPQQPGRFEFIPLDSVYFPHDIDLLNDRARLTLDTVARYITANPHTDRVLIIGHADYTGTEPYNYLLTDRRALNVRDYLVKQGISSHLLEVTSAGENDAVDENWTRSGQARNRRVQLFAIQVQKRIDASTPPAATENIAPPSPSPPPADAAPAPYLYPGAFVPPGH